MVSRRRKGPTESGPFGRRDLGELDQELGVDLSDVGLDRDLSRFHDFEPGKRRGRER